MGKKKKQVMVEEKVSGAKRPNHIEKPGSFLSAFPVWGFKRMDSGGLWDLFAAEHLGEILKKLADFEKMTWAEIQRQTHDDNKSSSHYISVDKLSKIAQKRLRELKLDEFSDNIFSLRLKNKERLFGILMDGVFYVLWYDREHEICPSGK